MTTRSPIPVEREPREQSGTNGAPSHVPPWAQVIGAALIVALVGAVWRSNQADMAALADRATKAEARLTAAEIARASDAKALEDLTRSVADMRGDMKAGFEATRVSLAALSTQLTAATPHR